MLYNNWNNIQLKKIQREVIAGLYNLLKPREREMRQAEKETEREEIEKKDRVWQGSQEKGKEDNRQKERERQTDRRAAGGGGSILSLKEGNDR